MLFSPDSAWTLGCFLWNTRGRSWLRKGRMQRQEYCALNYIIICFLLNFIGLFCLLRKVPVEEQPDFNACLRKGRERRRPRGGQITSFRGGERGDNPPGRALRRQWLAHCHQRVVAWDYGEFRELEFKYITADIETHLDPLDPLTSGLLIFDFFPSDVFLGVVHQI